MPARSVTPCMRCRKPVELNQSAIAVCVYVRTVGIEAALRSPQEQAYCCSECAVAMVMGSEPPSTQPLNLLAYTLIRNMVASDLAVIVKAWGELRKALDLPNIGDDPEAAARAFHELRKVLALPEGEILPPAGQRALKAGRCDAVSGPSLREAV